MIDDEEQPHAGGRPRIAMTPEEFKKLGRWQTTHEDMAGWFECSRQTIENRLKEPAFRDAYDQGIGQGKTSLRMQQVAHSKMKSGAGVQMSIWLGKIWLGQKDRSAVEYGNIDGEALRHDAVLRIEQVIVPPPKYDED